MSMHFKPKKKLGQNFLFDQNVQRKLVAAFELSPQDIILEIGAGRGELTAYIAKIASFVYAVEIDKGLCQILKNKLNEFKNIKIVTKDILKLNLKTLLGEHNTKKIKVIGNIPYYISTPILAHLFKYREFVENIFITVQKEFAQRVIAKPGTKDYGALSCFVQYYAQPQVVFLIKKTSFFPQPKVDSCLLKLNLRPELPLALKDQRLFFRIVRASFNQRRKILRNSLKGVVPQERLDKFFAAFGLDPKTRPERLCLQYFINLVKS